MMETMLSLFLVFAMGAITAYYAGQRGRDPFAWFLIGLFLGIFGVILVFILPSLEDEKKITSDESQVYRFQKNLLEVEAVEATHTQNQEFLTKEWFYYDLNKTRQGPVTVEELKKMWKDKVLNGETYVWCEGLDDWKKIQELQALFTHLQFS